jgi:hypothetical protein
MAHLHNLIIPPALQLGMYFVSPFTVEQTSACSLPAGEAWSPTLTAS